MEIALKLCTEDGGFRLFPVTHNRFLIGRAEDCHLRPPSEGISRHHCALSVEPPHLVLRDMGSSNGTFINDARVVAAVELNSGDILKVGAIEFEVLLAHDRVPEAEPEEVVIEPVSGALDDDFSTEEAAAAWLGEAVPAGDTHIISRKEATEELRQELGGRMPKQSPAIPKDVSSNAAAEALRRLGTKRS